MKLELYPLFIPIFEKLRTNFIINLFCIFQIKGKDLPGAVNVLPAGLGAVLAKRQSSEFKMEVIMIFNKNPHCQKSYHSFSQFHS